MTAPGLERVVAEEVEALGIRAAPEAGGVGFAGDLETLYRANLHLRGATRVLVRVGRFRARSFIELERHARRLDWCSFVSDASTVSVRVSSRKSKLYHERAIAERFGRWIAEATGARVEGAVGAEGEEEEGTDSSHLFVVRIARDECLISADSSGALLHRRGYRQAVAKAPLRETLAAGMLLAARWRGDRPLLDPMCGSGTIPIEAALIARGIPPGLASAGRKPLSYAFERWPGFDGAKWQSIVERAAREIRAESPVEIFGSDRDEGAIEAARSNAARAGVGEDVRFHVAPLSAAPAPGSPGLVLVNPPYGVRIGETKALRDLYAALGKMARGRLKGWEVSFLAADEGLVRQTGLETRELLATANGGIQVRQHLATQTG